MRSGRLTAGGLGAALAVSALLAACGGDDEASRERPKARQLASARVIDSDP